MQTLSNPPTLEMPFAEQGDKNTIPVQATGTNGASLTEGFPEITMKPRDQGGLPPSGRDMNGLGYLLSSLYFHLQNGGQFTFNSDVSTAIGGYPLGAILSYTDTNTGLVYLVRSLVANNTYDFNDNPSYIDDVHWTKAYSEDLQNFVTLNTEQVILSKKIISGDFETFGNGWVFRTTGDSVNFPLHFQAPTYTKGDTPTRAIYGAVDLYGSAMTTHTDRIGKVEMSLNTSKLAKVDISAYDCDTSSTTANASVSICYPAGGSPYATAPASTVNNSIVTQIARSNSANGFIKFGNNVTIQKGTMSAGSGTSHTITFPTPFHGTNYKFCHTFTGNNGELYAGSVDTKKTASIVLHTAGGANTRGLDWIAVEIY